MESADGRFQFWDEGYGKVPPGTPPLGVHRLAYRCRHDPNRWCSLNLRGRGHDLENKSWTWDGNVDRPTVSPSVNCIECWHGYIVGGVFLTTDKTAEPVQ